MQNRIEEQSDFEMTVHDKPVELLKRIKRSMCAPARSKCEHKGALKTIEWFVVDAKQEENEDLTTCTKRFKQANDILSNLQAMTG